MCFFIKNKARYILMGFIFFMASGSIAQNLVYNGDFEIIDTCPHNIITPPYDAETISYAIGWFAASETPDVFNVCATGNYGVPYNNNGYGYQQDCCGGNGYAGEYVFYVNGGGYDNREYIYTKLTDTLQAGHKYLASMYVNSSNYWHNAIVTMGMLFTDTATVLPTGNTYIIKTTPQVISNVLLADTANWMLVQDTFVAQGGEGYLTIGNFNSDSTCGMNNSISSQESYYYIDNVSVYDVATMGVEQIKNIANSFDTRLFPNPNVGNEVYINTTNFNVGILNVRLTDLEGRVVFEKNCDVNESLTNFKMIEIKNGVYFVNITNTKTGEKVIKKLVIQY